MFFDWKFLDYNIKFWHYRWLDFVCPIVPLQTLSEPFLQKGGFEWHLLQPTGFILPTICSQDWSFLNLNLTPGRGMCKHLHIIQLYRPVWGRVNTLSLCAICFFIINVLNNNILSFSLHLFYSQLSIPQAYHILFLMDRHVILLFIVFIAFSIFVFYDYSSSLHLDRVS